MSDVVREFLRTRAEAADCRRCELWERATQTVFGEGPPDARVVLVGEQPGDQEDRTGHPFVGPAGKLLARAIAAAGIPEGEIYLTNAVKHFKWEPRGGRRIHKRPLDSEIDGVGAPQDLLGLSFLKVLLSSAAARS